MSLDPASLARSSSPASSEASLPKNQSRAYEDGLKKDKAYRRYASNVERALSLFDTTLQEWADYISFLSRLLKALQSHPLSLAVVPEKVIVAKRLAQCLNPSLPSGVHQKALEVYGYIFALLKPDGLARDLSLYLPGIAPTLTFASLSVRPLFLSLVETYIAHLDAACIRPALKAILLSLLPGLEEETSEDFETTLRIVNRFRDISSEVKGNISASDSHAGSQYFWQCLFLASITSPTRRMGVLAYLNRYFPKLGGHAPWAAPLNQAHPEEETEISASIASLTSPEPGLLIRCFATGLADDQLLVQRNYLDVLVTHLPLHSPVLQTRISADDLELLVAAAAGVVIRRDMSLNRRLWTWFLGPDLAQNSDENGDSDLKSITSGRSMFPSEKGIPKSKYFARFGLVPLVNSIKGMIARKYTVPQERAKPFRISLSLMDRWEVGGLIVPEIFLPVLRNVQEYYRVATPKAFDEVLRSASAFFDGVESSLIFSELLTLVLDMNQDVSDKVLGNLRLARFAISHFNIKEEEMLTIHIPLLLLGTLLTMKTLSSTKENSEISKSAFDEASWIAHHLLGLIPGRAFIQKPQGNQSHHQMIMTAENMTLDEISLQLHRFYAITKESLDDPEPPFTPKILAELLICEAHSQVIDALKAEKPHTRPKDQINFLLSLLKKVPLSQIFESGELYLAMYEKVSVAKGQLSMTTLSAICSIVTTLYSTHETGSYISYGQICDIVPYLVQQLWEFLSPLSPVFHVEAVRCFWLLHSISWNDRIVEAAITSLMIPSTTSSFSHRTSVDRVEKFFVLWNHSYQAGSSRSASRVIWEYPFDQTPGRDSQSAYRLSLLERPLFISLDLLASGPGRAYSMVKQWVQDPSTAYHVLDILTSKLSEFQYFRPDISIPSGIDAKAGLDDGDQCLYLFKAVLNTILALNHAGWSALTSKISPNCSKQALQTDVEDRSSLQSTIAQLSVRVLKERQQISTNMGLRGEDLQEVALFVLHQLLLGPGADSLYPLSLDTILIEQLSSCLDRNETTLQSAIIDAILPSLKIRFAHDTRELSAAMASKNQHRRSSLEALSNISRLSFTGERSEKDYIISQLPQPPSQLLDCLLKGIRAKSSRPMIDKWVHFLTECLPLYLGVIFQVLLKLVECLCKEINQSYKELQLMFQQTESASRNRSEHVTIALLTALENCIATAHDRLLLEESHGSATKTPDQPQSFFGNMVSGVFTAEASQPRSATANDRLTVLLCFQDAVRLCYSIWAWGDSGRGKDTRDSDCQASFQYTSLRMRNRSRRILEHLFTAETLECLETLIDLWRTSLRGGNRISGRSVFNLLHTLEGSRPKVAIPAVFNAIYSRTNPAALDPSRKSAMMSHLTEAELAAFLVMYARSLDEDVLDEIWLDCTTFLRDVLSNPFPHRQILSRLLEFAAILGEKMEHTTFGEDQRAKRDLGDILLRLLTAISTSKPIGASQDQSPKSRAVQNPDNQVSSLSKDLVIGPDDVYSILSSIMPALTTSFDADRIASAMSNISTNILAPLFHSRLFPQNINKTMLDILQQMSKIPSASRYWRKDVGDALNDPKFFGMKLNLVKSNWLGLLRQWTLTDKERLPELLSRLSQPSSAGIMFGVGASAARLEADRKSQLNLRRIALLILAADEDHFSGDLSGLQQKLEDLLAATHISSPSSATRAEVYMVLRALVLKTSTIHLAPFWPLINTELQEVVYTIAPGRESETYNPYCLLQACKLLETLLLTSPDDFQLQEWLFVTDTIDIIYPPDRWEAVALADEIALALGTTKNGSTAHLHETGERDDEFNRLWLGTDLSRETAKDEIVDRLLRPFFTRLSIHAFESTYSLGSPELLACQDDLLADLFNDFTIAS
ncbi:cellular morphogenesis regulator DopA [Coccidioides immitis RS]|uniref:Cellular morphogenesis regulator DopA n=3 Tax=Coccidioides immitis TaxID=5501 RepID=A0A0E1S4R8_COCIM|nr:cellular morphogenesis regulator DopA [Coccidioides immitis RS]EAS35703.1 cellular morphogenesis regulator DopA [Coccidioides immitis RS]